MLDDDILFHLVQGKNPGSVFQGNRRMAEVMIASVRLYRMGIIKVKVVQKTAPGS
jgi:hypothetical protein